MFNVLLVPEIVKTVCFSVFALASKNILATNYTNLHKLISDN